MFFVIQKEEGSNFDRVQSTIIRDVLDHSRENHEYILMELADLYSEEDHFVTEAGSNLKDRSEFDPKFFKAIAIGEIKFVEAFLKIFHGIEHENAIEVPPCLREEKFLKRKYSIIPVWEIPRKGKFFIKDATQQKVFSYKGELEEFIFDEMFEERKSEFDTSLRFDYEHLYQISEVVDIIAEYRVYVFAGQLETVSHFAGNAYMLPDYKLLREAIEIYNNQPDCPKSYSIDLMITPKGTAITEVHNFMCLGLYNVNWDERLLYAYRDGWNYVLNHNTLQTEFSNYD